MADLVSSPSKAQQVYALLRARILGGDLRPGERLNMDALAREFGISKIPVREAVSRLETQGLVTSRQHAAPTVASIDPAQLRGAYLARAQVEPLVARLAAQSADAGALSRLAGIQAQMREAFESGRMERLGDLNYAFHVALAQMSGYDILVELVESLLLSVRRHRVIDPLSTANWAHVVDEHDTLLEALRHGDPDGSAAAARAHAESQAGHDHATIDTATEAAEAQSN